MRRSLQKWITFACGQFLSLFLKSGTNWFYGPNFAVKHEVKLHAAGKWIIVRWGEKSKIDNQIFIYWYFSSFGDTREKMCFLLSALRMRSPLSEVLLANCKTTTTTTSKTFRLKFEWRDENFPATEKNIFTVNIGNEVKRQFSEWTTQINSDCNVKRTITGAQMVKKNPSPIISLTFIMHEEVFFYYRKNGGKNAAHFFETFV